MELCIIPESNMASMLQQDKSNVLIEYRGAWYYMEAETGDTGLQLKVYLQFLLMFRWLLFTIVIKYL